MLKEFAVEPDCIRSVDKLKLIAEQCGIRSGRHISMFPRYQWPCDVLKAIGSESYSATQRIKDIIIRLERRGGLVDTGRLFTRELSWRENAIEQHRCDPFSGIVAVERFCDDACVCGIDDLSSESPPWLVKTHDQIPRTEDALCTCATPLFKRAKKVLLVDPHFTPDTKRYESSLMALVRLAATVSARDASIELHAKRLPKAGATEEEKSNWVDQFVSACQARLPRLIPKGVRLRVQLWAEKNGGERLHARYLMTDRGAILVESGLDLGNNGEMTDVALVDPDVFRRRWSDMEEGATTYEDVKTFVVEGTAVRRD